MHLSRWQRVFLSVCSGILLSGGWAGSYWQLMVFFAFVPLLIIEHFFCTYKNEYKAYYFFRLSFLSFLIWNALSVWWIYYATIIGAILAIVLNALFMTLVMYLYHIFKRRNSLFLSCVFFIVVWLSFEYIHLNWELSWPWLTLGNAFSENTWLIQWYEYTGVLGGSLWILVINLLIFLMIIKWYENNWTPRSLIYTFIVVLIFPTGFSLWRYFTYKECGNKAKVLVIQPNIDPYNDKFTGMSVEQQIERMKYLIKKGYDQEVEYVVCPETALPQGIWEEDLKIHPHVKEFIEMSKQLNVKFVIGASTFKYYKTKETSTARKLEGGYYDAFNTVLFIDKDNIQIYHKSLLVLGVEKMPFSEFLGFLEPLALDLGGTSGSLGVQDTPTVFVNKTKIAPAICYESIYGEYLSKFIKKGAQWLCVVTNDGWWGDTPGYKQHLSYSRLRAIEFRKYIARSANTGISAIINQKGDIINRTLWWKPMYVKNYILFNNTETFYSVAGDYLGRISLFILSVLTTYAISQSFQRYLEKRKLT
ncbi:MAG: apolipoprotein N-acyltransferase [Bacteroidales bacterium]|nr:apolipoprotein N-acyltransferase [Bacteroidales bacterium]